MFSRETLFLSSKITKPIKRYSLKLSGGLFSFPGRSKSNPSTNFKFNKTKFKNQNTKRKAIEHLKAIKKAVL